MPTRSQIKVWGGLAVIVAVSFAAMVWFVDSRRLQEMRLEVRAHPSTLAVMTLVHNDLVALERSVRGRGHGRSMLYDNWHSTRLRFDLRWLDLIENRAYHATFEIDADDISSFGNARKNGSLKIVAGPGADVYVETPNAEAMRVIGLNLDVDLSKHHTQDVVLAQLCATPIAVDDPRVAGFRDNIEDWQLNAVTRNRDAYLRQNPAQTPRCPTS